MNYQLQLGNISLNEAERVAIEKKIQRLEKYLNDPYTVDLRFIRDTHHTKGEIIECKLNIEQGRKVFHAERKADTTQTALDQAIEAMSKELAKHRDRQKDHRA